MIARLKKPAWVLIIIITFIISMSTFFLSLPSPDHNQAKVQTNLFLSIVVVSKIENQLQRKTIRETWAQNIGNDVSVKFAVSNGAGIAEESNEFGDLLILDIEDSYDKLTDKILMTFSTILKAAQFTYLLKCDDDSYVFIEKLVALLQQQKTEKLYMGYFKGNAHVQTRGVWFEKNWNLCDRYLPYAQGGGYILSYDLVKYITENAAILKRFKSEDVSVGAWLAPLDINKVHDIGFNTEWKSRGCSNNDIVTHKQSPIMMLEIHDNIQSSGKPCAIETSVRRTYQYNWEVLPSQCCSNFVER